MSLGQPVEDLEANVMSVRCMILSRVSQTHDELCRAHRFFGTL
jgi:hypothetical protein